MWEPSHEMHTDGGNRGMYAVAGGIVCKVFIIMAVGFYAGKKGLIDDRASKLLSALMMDIVLPFGIISSSQQIFSADQLKEMGVSLLLSVGYYIVTLLVCQFLAGRLGLTESGRIIFVLTAVFANVGFMGFAVMQELLGDVGTLYTVVHNSMYQVFFFSYGMYLLEGNKKLSIRSLFGSRIIWISFLSIVLYLMPFRFPQAVAGAFSTIGGMLMPLSMLIIGAQMGRMELKNFLGDKRVFLVDALRMLIFPAVMFLAVKALGISHDTAVTAFVLSALPSGSLNVVMAETYRREPEFATVAVAQNMLLMIVTLPVVILLTGYL